MRLKIGHISKIFLIVLALQNSVNIVINDRPLFDFVTDVAVFLLFALALIILEKKFTDKRIHSVLFFISGIMGQLLTTQGNFAPAVFFCMAIFCFNHKHFTIAVLVTASFTIFLKAILNSYTVNDVINLFMIESLMFFYYYKLWHPKKVRLEDIDGFTEDDTEIIEGMISGKTVKEIGFELGLTASAIRSKQEKMRRKMNAESNSQLIYNLSCSSLLSKRE